jgi:hypothetical protein
MKTRLVIIGSLLAAFAVWVGACTPQPPLPCPVQTANPYVGLPPFAVFFKLKSGTGACAAKDGTVEDFGFQKYNKPLTDETHLAVRPGYLGALWSAGRVDSSDPEGEKINGLGDIGKKPGSDNLCPVSFDDEHAEQAQQNFDAVPDMDDGDGGTIPGSPALSIKYEWTEMKFLATAEVPGSAFFGELKYTEDACTATYAVEGLWPKVTCDATAYALPDGSKDLPDGGMLEDLDCAAYQNVPLGHTLGSGINPDFPVVCDETLAVCVLGTRDRGTRAITRQSVEQDLTRLGQ